MLTFWQQIPVWLIFIICGFVAGQVLPRLADRIIVYVTAAGFGLLLGMMLMCDL